MKKPKKLTAEQRSALLVHLDACAFAWATSPQGPVEDLLSGHLDALAERLGLTSGEYERLTDAACERAQRIAPHTTVMDALGMEW